MENSTDVGELINSVNKALTNSKTRNFGLETLQTLLPHCPNGILMENILHWTSYCIVQNKEDAVKELKLNTLARIIENSYNLEVFDKKFVAEYLNVTLRTCLSYRSNEEHVAALNCLKQCMKKYPSWFGNHKQKIQPFLIECLDSSCGLLTETAASTFVCFLETGPAGQNGINYITNFSKEFKRICATVHLLYNSFLNEIFEGHSFVKIDEDVVEFSKLACDIPSVDRLDVLATRIISCLCFIKSLITKRFSVEKRIQVKYLLDVVCRGLSVHVCTSVYAISNSKDDHSTYLRRLQLHLLSILRACMKRFYTLFIPFSVVIENLFLNVLRSVDKCNCFIIDTSVKTSVYKSLNIWLLAINAISNESQFQEKLITIIFKDIMTPKKSILLNVQDSNHEDFLDRRVMNEDILYVRALETLKCLLSSSFSVNENVLKEILLVITERLNCPNVNENDGTQNYVLHQVTLYEVLISLIKKGPFQSLVSVHFIINLLNKGLTNKHWQISQTARTGLDLLEKISQPLCPSLHPGSIRSPLQDTHLNNLASTDGETSQSSDNQCNKKINILSNFLMDESCTVRSPLKETRLNNLSSVDCKTSVLASGSEYECKKEINILSDILINTSNIEQVNIENQCDNNSETTQHTEASREEDAVISLSDSEEAVKHDIKPVVSVPSDVALEKMCCAFQDVIQD